MVRSSSNRKARKRRTREDRQRYSDNMRTPGIASGSFIGVRRHVGRDHTTVWIEGDSADGPSVAAIALDDAGLDRLIRRLENIREQHRPTRKIGGTGAPET